MEESPSIIVFISHCRGIRFIIFQITSCKANFISVLTLCCPFVICHRYAEPFSKTCSNCSDLFLFLVIQSVWLYNILVLVNYHKKNTSIQKLVDVLKVKITISQNRSIFASAKSLNLCNDYVFYFMNKTNHPISSNSHLSATAKKAICSLKIGGVYKTNRNII